MLTLIRCPFHPRVTAVAYERPRSFCQKCGCRSHLNAHIPFIQRSRSGLTMLLSRYSVGTYQEMSSNATHQGTLSHSCFSSLSGISVHELISTRNKNKNHRRGMNCQTFLQKSLHAGRKSPPLKSTGIGKYHYNIYI